MFKKFHDNVDSVDYEDLDNYGDDEFADDDEYRKIETIRRLFKNDYYKPIRTDDGFSGRKNNCIEYTSRGDRYRNLSPKECLDMIRTYSRDLISDHRPKAELNNDSDAERGEWKVQLVMQNNYISTKDFEETRTIYSASKLLWTMIQMTPSIDFSIHFYKDFNKQQKYQMIEKANLPIKVFFYCIVIFKNQTLKELNMHKVSRMVSTQISNNKSKI